jgi:hypothetical protein
VLVPSFRHQFGRSFAIGACLALAACSARDGSPGDPATARYQQQQEVAAAEASAAYRAEQAERWQAALVIENAPPELIDEEQFYQLLGYHCGDCHFPPDGPTEGVYDFNNLDRLIETHKVIPGDAEASRVVLRMRRGDMPPPEVSQVPPMPEVAIDLIADFINRLPVTEP